MRQTNFALMLSPEGFIEVGSLTWQQPILSFPFWVLQPTSRCDSVAPRGPDSSRTSVGMLLLCIFTHRLVPTVRPLLRSQPL